jgi:hypothetical protein
MSMQTMRLETKDGLLVAEVQLPANGEPDAIEIGGRVFIRRPMRVSEPPTKNDPETYFEATTHHVPASLTAGRIVPAPKFDKVTEAAAPIAIGDSKRARGSFGSRGD